MKNKRQRADQDAIQESIAISILAGGQSARMGRDKTRLRLGRRTLLAQVRSTAEATGWPVRIIRRDVVSRCGPLGGIYTALKSTRAGVELFLACDMPFISQDLLFKMVRRLGAGRNALFATADGTAGFPCLIRSVALPVVERHIEARKHSLQALAEALRAKRYRVPKNQILELWNINTREDWHNAMRLREAHLRRRTSARD